MCFQLAYPHLRTADTLEASDGSKYKLQPPSADELPQKGFDPGEDLFQVRADPSKRGYESPHAAQLDYYFH